MLHCKSYRDILFASASGKRYTKNIRAQITPYLNSYILDSMCGGFLKRGMDFCSHFLKAIKSIAESSHSSCLFLADLRSASATVSRSPAFPPDNCSDEFAAHVFTYLNFNESIMQDFISVLRLPSAIEYAGAPEHLLELLPNWHLIIFLCWRVSLNWSSVPKILVLESPSLPCCLAF